LVGMQACGVSVTRLARPVLLVAAIGTAATAYETIVALPDANQKYREIVFVEPSRVLTVMLSAPIAVTVPTPDHGPPVEVDLEIAVVAGCCNRKKKKICVLLTRIRVNSDARWMRQLALVHGPRRSKYLSKQRMNSRHNHSLPAPSRRRHVQMFRVKEGDELVSVDVSSLASAADVLQLVVIKEVHNSEMLLILLKI